MISEVFQGKNLKKVTVNGLRIRSDYTEFQDLVSWILLYAGNKCRQPELAFGLFRFCLSVEKSPELDAPYFQYLMNGERVFVVAG